jgi:hypothetical protein
VRVIRNIIRLWTDPAAARAEPGAVLADSEKSGNAFPALVASATVSITALIERDGDAGLRWADTILRLYDQLGTQALADTLETRGNHYVNASRYPEAVRCYAAANARTPVSAGGGHVTQAPTSCWPRLALSCQVRNTTARGRPENA